MTTAVRARRRTAVLASAAVAALAGAVLTVTLSSPVSAATPPPVTSGSTYTVVNLNSGKCVDARAAGTANGTAVQQYTCNGTTAQNWVFTATSGGYFQVGTANASAQVWDDTNVSTADSSPIQLWLYGGGNNQQWLPVAEASGTLPLRQPVQRQVPGRAERLHRGQRPAAAVRLQRHRARSRSR